MSGMRLIVKTITRVTTGLVFVFGLFLTLQGHIDLGGGIAGGVIIALASALEVLAFGKTEQEMERSKSRAMTSLITGSLSFMVLSLAGYFLGNFLPKGTPGQLLSGGTIPLYNIAMLLAIGGGLYSIFLELISFKVEVREEEQE